MEIAPATRMGPVELSVSDIDRAVEYWRDTVGLRVLARDGGRASLGADTELVRLVEEPGARPADGFTGLYHVALLVPDRTSLSRWLAHAARGRIPLEGLSDHAVSEAIYLRDPDRHGIEIYADRPREQWEGRVGELMTTVPLDVDGLLAEAAGEPFEGLPDGTTVGHVHFRVAAIDDTVRFYRDVLGLGLTARLGPMAAFLSAGGYHHHVGANTWESRGAPPPPRGAATIRLATVLVPDPAEVDRIVTHVADAGQDPEPREDGVLVRDPSRNPLLLATPAR